LGIIARLGGADDVIKLINSGELEGMLKKG
jgi:hypothetical protein